MSRWISSMIGEEIMVCLTLTMAKLLDPVGYASA
jgi:hypothetical protein